MQKNKNIAILLVCLALAACRTTPQSKISLSSDTLKNGKVGVIMPALPKVDTSFPGAACLLCLAAASAANSSLTSHAHTMSNQELAKLKEEVADTLRKSGADVTVIAEDLNLKALKDGTPGENMPKKDYRPLKEKYHVDHLAIVSITFEGFVRNYSSYIPRGDAVAAVEGLVSVVDLSSNHYELFQPLNIIKTADGPWSEAPDYPGLTNAYYSATEACKDQTLRAFRP